MPDDDIEWLEIRYSASEATAADYQVLGHEDTRLAAESKAAGWRAHPDQPHVWIEPMTRPAAAAPIVGPPPPATPMPRLPRMSLEEASKHQFPGNVDGDADSGTSGLNK